MKKEQMEKKKKDGNIKPEKKMYIKPGIEEEEDFKTFSLTCTNSTVEQVGCCAAQSN